MASVFWDAHGILFMDNLEKGKTIKSDYYMALFDRLSAEIKKKRPHMQKKKSAHFAGTFSSYKFISCNLILKLTSIL